MLLSTHGLLLILLQDELTVESEGKRLAAVELLCKLFSDPGIGGGAMQVGVLGAQGGSC